MIDYDIIANSIKHYSAQGFTRIEVPWTVTKGVADITRPIDAPEFRLVHENNKVLVASAEQSFLYQYAKGFLPKGKFQAITPCFRKESFDSLHTKYFIKNELINTISTTNEDLLNMIYTAVEFFNNTLGKEVTVLPTSQLSYDIMYHDIELGSYGIRSCDFLTWIYGTGVAEPRLSAAMEKYVRIS